MYKFIHFDDNKLILNLPKNLVIITSGKRAKVSRIYTCHMFIADEKKKKLQNSYVINNYYNDKNKHNVSRRKLWLPDEGCHPCNVLAHVLSLYHAFAGGELSYLPFDTAKQHLQLQRGNRKTC